MFFINNNYKINIKNLYIICNFSLHSPVRERTEDTTTTETGSTITNESHSYDWEGNPVRKNVKFYKKKFFLCII